MPPLEEETLVGPAEEEPQAWQSTFRAFPGGRVWYPEEGEPANASPQGAMPSRQEPPSPDEAERRVGWSHSSSGSSGDFSGDEKEDVLKTYFGEDFCLELAETLVLRAFKDGKNDRSS